MKRPTVKILLLSSGIFILFRYLYPGNVQNLTPLDSQEIVAHRGMHTNWDSTQYDHATGCEATHIYPPTHEYIENTIPAIQAAFDHGATMVEIDIRPAKDGTLMISHEEDLECKTDGVGKIYDHTIEELKQLDVGYGFTHDDGQTYPFRGKGFGLMPTLNEVLETFPDKQFLIDHKDRRQETAQLLVDVLQQLPPEQQQLIKYWGSREIGKYIESELPLVKRLLANRSEMKKCIQPYLLSLGFMKFGNDCQDLAIGMSRNYSKFFWSWPNGFIRKAHDNGSKVFLMVDSLEELKWAQNVPADGIITDYIEVIGPELQGSR